MKPFIPILLLLMVLIAGSCTKETVIPDPSKDPFGKTTNPPGTHTDPDPSRTSIQGLHKYIFQPRCANPTCHDGSFEPDFRTVESSWSTLVYQKVIKNDSAYSYTYRVKPGNTLESWLMNRLTTDDVVLGRMPLYAAPLSETELTYIRTWISEGAKNSEGQALPLPNLAPEVLGFRAYDQTGLRMDSVKTKGFVSPFIIPQGTFAEMRFYLSDDKTPAQNLLDQKVKFSYSRDDFSQAREMNPSFFQAGQMRVYFQDSLFTPGQQVFVRYYARDPDHASVTEYPTTGTVWYAKEIFSFVVQ